MNTRLFVGNLDYSTRDEDLRAAFEPFGALRSSSVVLDRDTGRSRGFGFVEFEAAADAERAINELDGTALNGRNINVNVARERSGGGGGGGRRPR